MILLKTSNVIRTLYNPMYYKVLMYISDFIGVLSIMYITFYSSSFILFFGKNIKNSIDIEYLWIIAAIIVLKNIIIFYMKDTDNLIDRLLLAVTNILLNICSGILVSFSYSLSQLKSNYIDSIRLKYDFNITRIWNKDELKEYLLNKLLKEPGILIQIESLKVKLPLSEKLTSNILANSNTIEDVNNAVIKAIKMIKSEKELLEKEQAAGIINEIKNNVSLLSAKLYDYNPYWLLGCTAAGVVLMACIVFALGGIMFGEVDNISDKVTECEKKVNTLIENNTDDVLSENVLLIGKKAVGLEEKILDLNAAIRVVAKKVHSVDNKVVHVYGDVTEKLECLSSSVDELEQNLDGSNSALNTAITFLKEDAESANNLLAISASKMGKAMHERLALLEQSSLLSDEVTTEQEIQLKLILDFMKNTFNDKIQEINLLKEEIPSADSEALKEIVREIVKEILAQNS